MDESMDIKKELEALADMKFALDAIRLRMEDAVNSVLTPQQRKEIQDIREEFQVQIESAHASISLKEAQIKEAVAVHGQSIKSDRLSAIWSRGRVSWDTESLNFFAAQKEYEFLSKFRKEGSPIVSIRAK